MAAALKNAGAAIGLLSGGLLGGLVGGAVGEKVENTKKEGEDARKEQEALMAKQKKDLEDLEKGQELVKEGQAKSQKIKAGTAAKTGREGTLVGVLGSSASSGPAPVKTLLGS